MPKRIERPHPIEVPRLGPPENLRPAGAHKDKRRKTRAEEKAALRKAAFEFEDAKKRPQTVGDGIFKMPSA